MNGGGKSDIASEVRRGIHIDNHHRSDAIRSSGGYYSPPVPFRASVFGLMPPQKITIIGTPSDDFVVNLKSPDDVALHFNARFNEKVIVINCTIGGNRHRDERYESTFPFVCGQEFTLELIAGHGNFIVTANAKPLVTFAVRTDPQHITELEINGDLSLHSVHFG